jgi:hypothetical protein
VTDADGDPIPYGQVRLYKRLVSQGAPSNVSSEWADEAGHFRLWGLAPGTYYISALPELPETGKMRRPDTNSLDTSGHPFREREVETFYKAALTMANATPIVIKAGQEITDITIPIQKASSRRISGRISWDVHATGLPQIWLMAMSEGLRLTATVEKDGHFHAEGLTPAVYTLFAFAQNLERPPRQEQIDVTERDVDGILLQPSDPVEIKVAVHLEGSKAAPPFDELVLSSKNRPYSQGARASEDGTWHFSNLPPDSYNLGFWPKPNHYFVKAVLIDGERQSGDTLDFSARFPQTIEAVLALSTGSITGAVTNGKELVPASTILLMSEATEETVKVERLPAGGRFDIKPLAPGKYRFYALEDFDREAWAIDDLRSQLASKSVVFDLSDGEQRALSVPLISAKEYQAVLGKVGYTP